MAQGKKQPSLLGLAELGKASQGGPPSLWVFGDKQGRSVALSGVDHYWVFSLDK